MGTTEIIHSEERQADTPLDGGWGAEVNPLHIAIAHAKAEARARMGTPKEGVLEFITTVPYTGTEPIVTPVIRRPIDPGMVELLNLP